MHNENLNNKKIEELKKSIKDGTFKMNVNVIADKFIKNKKLIKKLLK